MSRYVLMLCMVAALAHVSFRCPCQETRPTNKAKSILASNERGCGCGCGSKKDKVIL